MSHDKLQTNFKVSELFQVARFFHDMKVNISKIVCEKRKEKKNQQLDEISLIC